MAKKKVKPIEVEEINDSILNAVAKPRYILTEEERTAAWQEYAERREKEYKELEKSLELQKKKPDIGFWLGIVQVVVSIIIKIFRKK